MQGHDPASGGVVTPEAVRLEFTAAGIGSRSLALFIDLALQGTALLVLALAGGAVLAQAGTGLPDWAGVSLLLLLTFAVFWGYPVAMETLWRGRTVGKAAMGLRVVTQEGAPVRFRHAALRALLALVDFYLTSGAAAVVSALVTRQHQRLGDLVAGTLVLRERTGARPPSAVRFTVPAGAEDYAATLDPAGVTAAEYATVRSFLLRAQGLQPGARADLARRLAQPLAARLGHVPPSGVGPELFLVCLAARYQQRGVRPPGRGAHAAASADPAGWPGPALPDPVPQAEPPPAPGGFAPPR